MKKRGNNGTVRPVGILQPSTRVGWTMIGDVRTLAKQYTTDSINTIYEIMMDKANNPGARLVAAQTLLDRGWGKAAQIIEGEIGFTHKSDDELRAELRHVIAGTIISDSPDSGRIELETESEGMPE